MCCKKGVVGTVAWGVGSVVSMGVVSKYAFKEVC